MQKKQIQDELKPKNKLSPTPIRMLVLICIIGLIMISIVGYGFFKGDRMAKTYAPLIDAVMEIKFEATSAHLWFEEIISGDRNEEIGKVWKHQDQAVWYAKAMLEGGKNSEGTFMPLDDDELCSKIENVLEKLKEFNKITQKRFEAKELSGVGTDIDQKYDTIFQHFLKDADDVETKLQQIMANDLSRFRTTQVLLIIITILLFLVIGISFWYFDNKRLKNLLLLDQANRALRKSEENLSITLNSIGDAVIATDTQGRIVHMNPVAEHLTGWIIEEAQGVALDEAFNIVNAKTKQTADNPVKRVLETGKIVGLANHTMLISKNGSRYQIADSAAPIKDDTGNIFGVVLVFRDVTEEYRMREAVLESENKYRSIFENAVEGFFQSTPQGHFITVNPTFAKMLGYTSPKELTSSISDIEKQYYVNREDRYRYKQLLQQVGYVEHFEFKARCKDGSHIWVSNSTRVVYDQDGKIVLYEGNVSDITDRKKAEGKVLRFDRIFEDSLNEIYLFDADTLKFTQVNTAAQHNLGYTMAEFQKMTPLTFKPEFTKESFAELVAPLRIGEKKKIVFETVHERKNRSFYDVEVHLQLLKDDQNTVFAAIILDITDRKKLEFQLRQAQKMEAIGTLAGGIAHDFNNILFPIVGHTEMLLEDAPEDSPFREGLNHIYTGALRASDLVKQILTFSRQENNDLELIKMQPIIKEALKFIRSSIPATIEIKQDINPDCGVIKADPIQIHQVVMNLATNAYHAMEETGGVLNVSLKENQLDAQDVIKPNMAPGIYVRLTIADTGKGMNKELIQKIFDPFFTTKEKGKGTGMGLSVVHGIVAGMNGAVKVFSEPGKGTQFFVYLPVEKHLSEKYVTHSKKAIQGGTEHILLVDDEEEILTMEKKILERLGYQVTSRTSSIDALEAFRADPDKFDMVITDMAMPNLSGDRLSSELTKIHSDIPILLCTGFSETMSEEKAALLGIHGFLLKPIVMKDLANKIREVLDKNKKLK